MGWVSDLVSTGVAVLRVVCTGSAPAVSDGVCRSHDRRMQHIPDDLNGRAFTIAEAADRGLSRRSLDGRRFVRIHRGVYRTAATAPTLPLMLDAAQLVLPADVAISHLTALRVFGLDVGPELPLHFSTNRRVQIDRDDVVVHRRQDRLFVEQWSGRPVLSPVRTFVDVATQLGERKLLQVGDWLVQHCDARPPAPGGPRGSGLAGHRDHRGRHGSAQHDGDPCPPSTTGSRARHLKDQDLLPNPRDPSAERCAG